MILVGNLSQLGSPFFLRHVYMYLLLLAILGKFKSPVLKNFSMITCGAINREFLPWV